MQRISYSPAGAFQLKVLVPGNTKADVSIPVVEGTTEVYLNQIPHAVEPQNGYATLFGLGAGCHLVTAEADSRASEDEALLSACSPAPVDGGAGGEPVAPALGPSGAPTTDSTSAAGGGASNGDTPSTAPSSAGSSSGAASASVSSTGASDTSRTAATCSMW